MKNEKKLAIAQKLKEAEKTKETIASEAKAVIEYTELRKKELDQITQSIRDLGDALQVEISVDLDPLLNKLDILKELPESYSQVKELAQKTHDLLSEDKEVSIKGFRDLWEMLVRSNNENTKQNREAFKETLSSIEKFADLQAYIDQLTETLKQGQQPEDFKPVRLVVGGDGVPLKFLQDMPSGSRSAGGGGLTKFQTLGGQEQIVDENHPLPVQAELEVSDIEIGAVEIKDGDSDTRLDVESSGTKNAAYVQSETLAKESGGNLASTATSLGVIDDWDESDRAKVNPIVGQAGVEAGAGVLTSKTIRVTEATDSNPTIVSTVNSTTTPLLANGNFNDANNSRYEDLLNIQQLGVTLYVEPNIIPNGDGSDAKGSLFIDFNDTNTGDADIQIPYVVRKPGLFIPQVPIVVKRYGGIRYYNDGGASAIAALGLVETAGTATAQTVFRLTTIKYPKATKELLRTLDQTVNDSDPASLQLAVLVGKNPAGNNVKVRTSVSGALEVETGEKTIINSDHFSNGIDTGEWTETNSGTGDVAATAGVARFTTGTTANSSATLTGNQTWPYRPGTFTLFEADVRMGDTGTTNNTRRWGMFNTNDGYFFELAGTTLKAVARSNVSGSPVDSATTITTFTKDTNNHTYQIKFQRNYASFLIDGVEHVALTNNSSAARTATLDLPLAFSNTNSGGGTTDVTMDVRGVSQSTIGFTDPEAGHPSYYAGSSGSVSVGSSERVVAIHAMSENNAGTVRIDIGGVTGSSIPVRNNWGWEVNPYGQIIGPTIVFTSTVSYGVWVVKD